MAALRDAESAGPERRPKLAKATAAFRSFLQGIRVVELLENNPFGVAVPVARLGAALDEIMAAA